MRRLIGQIRQWIEREHGEVNYYYITQFLTAALDNAEHTFFACTRSSDKRIELERTIGCLTPDTIVGMMIRKKENWDACVDFFFVEKVLREKKADEHLGGDIRTQNIG